MGILIDGCFFIFCYFFFFGGVCTSCARNFGLVDLGLWADGMVIVRLSR